jgi:hypothetical protein
MGLSLQHILVLFLVAGCAMVVAGQAVRTLRGKKSRLGSCCAKGCDAEKPQTPRVHFMPADMLRKRS